MRNQLCVHWVQTLYPTFHPLSANLMREICAFLDYFHTKIAAISNDQLWLYDVQRREVVQMHLSLSFSYGSVYCFPSPQRLMCIGSFPDMQCAFLIALSTGEVERIAPLREYRIAPGILPYQGNVYLFGGLNKERTKSCEMRGKGTGKWRVLPEMACQRANFSPCLYGQEVILLSVHAVSPILELFHIIKETFQAVSLAIPVTKPTFACQFIQNDDLIVITEEKVLLKWRIGQNEVQVGTLETKQLIRGQGQPVMYGKSVYFGAESRGKLVCFDMDREEMYEVTDFMPVGSIN